jgi:hypothetical protein
MDLTATLTVAQIETLSEYSTLSIYDAIRYYNRSRAAGIDRNGNDFEKSLRVKNTLDLFETRTRAEPSAQALAVLINCEYLLWDLNKDTPLKRNPFLSHWVEAVQRLDVVPGRQKGGFLSAENISVARALWIKILLQGEDTTLLLDQTPQEVSKTLLREGFRKPFDLKLYIRMLEDEGIYDKTLESDSNGISSSAQSQVSDHTHGISTSTKKTKPSAEDLIRKRKDNILHELDMDSNIAVFEITRLPISLTYLDFVTKILTDRTLEKHSIDPAPVITQYIQHALRTVERMGKPPSPTSNADEERAEGEMLEYGKEAQSRHILLLLLFIKSLIRKGLVEMDTLFYEIAEITVRYVWIKEVRDFRTWAEEGVEQEGG